MACSCNKGSRLLERKGGRVKTASCNCSGGKAKRMAGGGDFAGFEQPTGYSPLFGEKTDEGQRKEALVNSVRNTLHGAGSTAASFARDAYLKGQNYRASKKLEEAEKARAAEVQKQATANDGDVVPSGSVRTVNPYGVNTQSPWGIEGAGPVAAFVPTPTTTTSNALQEEEIQAMQDGDRITRVDGTFTKAPVGRTQAGAITYTDDDGNSAVRQFYTRKRMTPQGVPVTDAYGYDIKMLPDSASFGAYKADTTRFYAPRIEPNNKFIGKVIPKEKAPAFDDSVSVRKNALHLNDIYLYGKPYKTTDEVSAAKRAIRTVPNKQDGGTLEEGIQNIRNMFK